MPQKLTSICVYCGCNTGSDPRYALQAAKLGRVLGERGIRLVYGGSNCGTMGILAQSCLDAGGQVLGVIPQFLDERVESLPGAEKLVVKSMAERKEAFMREADALVALPGGVGTAEELLEAICWQTLGLNRKPVGVLDDGDFFAPLRAWLDGMCEAGFYQNRRRDALVFAQEPEELLAKLADFTYEDFPKFEH